MLVRYMASVIHLDHSRLLILFRNVTLPWFLCAFAFASCYLVYPEEGKRLKH